MIEIQHRRYTIRFARPTDAGLLSALAMRSKSHWGYPREFLEACRDELSYSSEQIEDRERYVFAIAEEEGVAVGFHALERLPRDRFELAALFVEPDHIGKGIGRALMEHAKRAAAERGGKSLVVQSDPNAAGFYKASGGVLTGRQASNSIPGRLLPVFTLSLESP